MIKNQKSPLFGWSENRNVLRLNVNAHCMWNCMLSSTLLSNLISTGLWEPSLQYETFGFNMIRSQALEFTSQSVRALVIECQKILYWEYWEKALPLMLCITKTNHQRIYPYIDSDNAYMRMYFIAMNRKQMKYFVHFYMQSRLFL